VRAVLDPNVLVSAAISPAGPSAQIVLAWADGRFELVVSAHLLDELGEVLAREKFRRWIGADAAAEYVAVLGEAAIMVGDPASRPSASPDPDDDYLLAVARAAQADYLVSGDPHLADLANPEPPVLTPRQFVDRLLEAEVDTEVD
jgi:putative PIN family toxin of toxin-antitoxin system